MCLRQEDASTTVLWFEQSRVSRCKRWALSGHWLKGGNVGFKKLLLVLESAELANEEQENDCVVGLFVEERDRPGRLSVVGTLQRSQIDISPSYLLSSRISSAGS